MIYHDSWFMMRLTDVCANNTATSPPGTGVASQPAATFTRFRLREDLSSDTWGSVFGFDETLLGLRFTMVYVYVYVHMVFSWTHTDSHCLRGTLWHLVAIGIRSAKDLGEGSGAQVELCWAVFNWPSRIKKRDVYRCLLRRISIIQLLASIVSSVFFIFSFPKLNETG